MRLLRILAAVCTAAFCTWGGALAASAQNANGSVWVQYESDGEPHVRAIVAHGPCPLLTVGTTSERMLQRSGPQPGFDDIVCDHVLPPHAVNARVGATRLPAIPKAPNTIAVFGDTGCRLKGDIVQACNDPVAWPFATIAKDIAAAHPDLVIHVGDYYYRETPCPGTVDCTNSPHGDNTNAWAADYFVPMAPLFATAPIVNVRGNHEDCVRSPLGWARYLSGMPILTCLDHEPVAFVAFDNLVLGEVDDATEVTEFMADPPAFETDEALVESHAAINNRETWLLVHRPPVAYEFAHAKADNFDPHIAAFLSGHIHTFGAYTLPGEAPQMILGMGGDNLALGSETKPLALLGGTTDTRFGYAIYQRNGQGWDVAVYDTNRAVHRRCRLEHRTVTCGAALTGKSS